jgi:transposase
MARRSFDVIDVVEILQHWHAGRSKSQVAASVGVDRSTVAKYVARAEAEGLRPGGEPLSRAAWAERVAGWFPGLVDAKARSLTFPEISRWHDQIVLLLDEVTVSTAWQRLRDEHGLQAGLTSFRRYVQLEGLGRGQPERVTVLRPPVEPGTEAQIDYGFLGKWVDPGTDRVRRVWAFVMVLSCSRHMFVRPVLSLDAVSWVDAHVRAFEFFGGVPARLVPDNLRTGVDRPDLYDPKINRAYAEMAEHYGCLVDPARAGRPKDKPRVERPMPYVRDSFWRGRRWTGEEHMQTAAIDWCRSVAGRRHHRSLDGASPLAVFNAIEQPALRALAHHHFEIARWVTAKVAADCHGSHVDVRITALRVEVFLHTELIKTHRRIAKGRATDPADYPPEKIAFFSRTPQWCRHQAANAGPHVRLVVDELLATNTLHHLRAAQGVLSLADRHGGARLDAACRRAIEAGDPSYRTVRGILRAGTEHNDQPTPTAPQAPAHLHGPDRLFNPDQEAAG